MKSIGTKLRERRTQMGLSLKEVSESTKIREQYLILLEKDDFTFQGPVYVRSFLKTYASYLKIPESEIAEKLENIQKIEKIVIPKETIEAEPPSTLPQFLFARTDEKWKVIKSFINDKFKFNWSNILAYIGIFLGILVILYFVFFTGTNEKAKTSRWDGSKTEDTNTGDTLLLKSSENLETSIENIKTFRLEAKAYDTVHLKLIIDGKSTEDVSMKTGMTRSWSAEEYFLVSMSRSGFIDFWRDGKVIEPFARKGTPVDNVKITRDNKVSYQAPIQTTPVAITTDTTSQQPKPRPKQKKKPKPEPILLAPSIPEKSINPLEKKTNLFDKKK